MAVSLTHTTVALGQDAGNGEIRKAQWNENHTLTMDPDKLLGRATAGTGAVEEIDCTAAGRALLDDATAAAQCTTLGLGTGNSPTFTGLTLTGVGGLSAGTALLPSLVRSNDTNTGMWFPAADTIAWSTGGSERLRIDSSGRLGIGTTSPGSQLHIASSTAFNPSLILANSTDNAFGPYWYSRKTRGSAAANSGDALGAFMFTSPDSGGTVQNACYMEALSAGAGATWHSAYFRFSSFDTSGAFGVRLIVAEQSVQIRDGTAALPGLSFISDVNTGIWRPTTDTVAVSTNGSERLRIDSSGNVGIGTSTFGTSAAGVFSLANATAPSTGPADTLQIYSSDLSAGNTMLSLWTEGTVVNANVTAATTHRIAIRVNGTVYYLLANTSA